MTNQKEVQIVDQMQAYFYPCQNKKNCLITGYICVSYTISKKCALRAYLFLMFFFCCSCCLKLWPHFTSCGENQVSKSCIKMCTVQSLSTLHYSVVYHCFCSEHPSTWGKEKHRRRAKWQQFWPYSLSGSYAFLRLVCLPLCCPEHFGRNSITFLLHCGNFSLIVFQIHIISCSISRLIGGMMPVSCRTAHFIK